LHLVYMILMFLSPPEPPQILYSETDSNSMLAMVLTPRHNRTRITDSQSILTLASTSELEALLALLKHGH
jgi:hypothetical protein